MNIPRYDRVQRGFHWSMAAIILVAIGIGVYCSYLPKGTSPRRELLDIHKSLGMTALVMIFLRIFYRLAKGAPPYRHALDRLSSLGAHGAHLALYALMLFMPFTGYMFSGAGGYSLPWFGLFTWPRLVPHSPGLEAVGEMLHWRGAWVIGALVTLHLLAVVWHRFIKRDEVLARMLPPG